MHSTRIAELLEPFLAAEPGHTHNACHSEPARTGEEPVVLSPTQLQTISIYIDLLRRWNARVNLTAIRDPEQIVTRHFGESLFAARSLFPGGDRVGPGASPGQAERGSADAASVMPAPDDDRGRAAPKGRVMAQEKTGALAPECAPNDQRPTTSDRVSLADLGSGAGFPGIPIKLWAPDISLTLIESNHKKAAFLREVTRALTLTDVNIQTARAETLTGATFDVVTLRAVERFQAVLPTAVRLLAPRGRLALLISAAQFDAARSALPDLVWAAPQPVPLSGSRILAVAHQ